MAAPAVLEFNPDGTFIRGWAVRARVTNGPRPSMASPSTIAASCGLRAAGRTMNQILKFTQDGKFLMQIGHSGQSKGNTDTKNVHQAADVYVYRRPTRSSWPTATATGA